MALGAATGEGDDAVLAALALPHEQPPLRQRAFREIQVSRLAAGEQPGDLGGRQGRHDRARQADVAEVAEGALAGRLLVKRAR